MIADVNNLVFTILIYAGSLVAGLLGSLTGLGGGVIVVPMLTVFFGVDIHFAAGASLISVIATSSGAASSYVKEGFSNIRIGMFLEMATTSGAVLGAFLAASIPANIISLIFAAILIYSVLVSVVLKKGTVDPAKENKLAEVLKLEGKYPSPTGMTGYAAQHIPLGFGLSSFAGILSGLLGIGGGAIKVLVMERIMKVPFKVAVTTSNFMIGVTAAASAGIYLKHGYIHAPLVMPVMLGVLTGAFLGAKLLTGASSKTLKFIFSVIILIMAYEMIKIGIR